MIDFVLGILMHWQMLWVKHCRSNRKRFINYLPQCKARGRLSHPINQAKLTLSTVKSHRHVQQHWICVHIQLIFFTLLLNTVCCFKGPQLYWFSIVVLSSWSPVEQPRMNNYPKKPGLNFSCFVVASQRVDLQNCMFFFRKEEQAKEVINGWISDKFTVRLETHFIVIKHQWSDFHIIWDL